MWPGRRGGASGEESLTAEPGERELSVSEGGREEVRGRGRCPRRALLTAAPPLPPETVRTATPFPMVSLFLVFTAFVISNIGHIRPQRTILAFVSGIFFILSGEPGGTGFGSRSLWCLFHKEKNPTSLPCSRGGDADPARAPPLLRGVEIVCVSGLFRGPNHRNAYWMLIGYQAPF